MKPSIPTTGAVRLRLLAFMVDKGWTPTEFAVEAGVSEGSVRHIGSKDWLPSFRIVRKLEAIVPDDFPGVKSGIEADDAGEGTAAALPHQLQVSRGDDPAASIPAVSRGTDGAPGRNHGRAA